MKTFEKTFEVILDGEIIAVCRGIRSAILLAVAKTLQTGKACCLRESGEKPFFTTEKILELVTAADFIYGRREFF